MRYHIICAKFQTSKVRQSLNEKEKIFKLIQIRELLNESHSGVNNNPA